MKKHIFSPCQTTNQSVTDHYFTFRFSGGKLCYLDTQMYGIFTYMFLIEINQMYINITIPYIELSGIVFFVAPPNQIIDSNSFCCGGLGSLSFMNVFQPMVSTPKEISFKRTFTQNNSPFSLKSSARICRSSANSISAQKSTPKLYKKTRRKPGN